MYIDKIVTSNTHMHDHSVYWLGTGASMKGVDVKLAFCGSFRVS